MITTFLYVCMVNTIYLLSFVETPRKFIIAELSIRKLGSSSVLIIPIIITYTCIISTDEDPSLPIESSAIINLRGVSTKLNKYMITLMHVLPITTKPSCIKCLYIKIRLGEDDNLWKNPVSATGMSNLL